MVELNLQLFGGRGSSSGGGGGGGANASESQNQQGGTLTGQKAVEEVSKLGVGSVIELIYDDGTVDTFKYGSKYYSGIGHSVNAWVKTSGNGYQNDFAGNKLTLSSTFFNKKVRIKTDR